MTLSVAPATLVGFVLVLVRASAWLVTAPPFAGRMVPARVKVGLAAAMAVALGPRIAQGATVPVDTAPLIGAVVTQVVVGVALGFVAQLVLSAVQAAGGFIDLFGGFTVTAAFDPLSTNHSAVLGRAYQLLAVTLLFAVNGHLVLMQGFLRSFDAVPVSGIHLGGLATVLTRDLALLFVAALEIAAPLLAALFLADVALGLLTRAAPQLNAIMLAFPLKVLLTLALLGFALPLLPGAVHGLLDRVSESTAAVLRSL
ncbi:MAG TPA: flagellar biosynthetic protein FliR [Acidimicrobiales bacterium]|nr:flagellar biosynthetic protein FliR [Acidimicrobiales bacterium]